MFLPVRKGPWTQEPVRHLTLVHISAFLGYNVIELTLVSVAVRPHTHGDISTLFWHFSDHGKRDGFG